MAIDKQTVTSKFNDKTNQSGYQRLFLSALTEDFSPGSIKDTVRINKQTAAYIPTKPWTLAINSRVTSAI